MRFLWILLIFTPLIYTYSFIKYSWNNNNKRAAIGAGILATASIVLPTVVLTLR
jgi:hypothetical protein